MKSHAKSPLRYPGGKSRAIQQIMPLIPVNIREYREPFIGGGSVFLSVKSFFKKQATYTINDLNYDLVCFWQWVRDDADSLIKAVAHYREQYTNMGRDLYLYWKDESHICTDFDRAVRFFIMNRITFSGVMDAGGYSQQAFDKRFTLSSIQRISKIAPALKETTILHGDYESLLFEPGERAFIFLDPPYWSATQSRLYGERGELHTTFDHDRFAENMRKCPHRWLLTYDDSPRIRELFSFANIIEWELQYGMNNYKQGSAAKGKELFIRNY
jgi:DNA adenine methylase